MLRSTGLKGTKLKRILKKNKKTTKKNKEQPHSDIIQAG